MKALFTNFEWPKKNNFPEIMPPDAEYVATVEWSWLPGHDRQDTYYISKDDAEEYWILWVELLDDIEPSQPYAYGIDANYSEDVAVRKLLKVAWSGDSLDKFHGVTSEGLLSVGDLDDIADTVVWS